MSDLGVISNEEFERLIKDEKSIMYGLIYESIKKSFESNLDMANILIVEMSNGSIMEINSLSSEWIRSLTLALECFSKLEQYEKCVEIKNLMLNIQTSQKK